MWHLWEWGEKKCMPDFGRKAEGVRSIGRPRRRWEENIKLTFKVRMWHLWEWGEEKCMPDFGRKAEGIRSIGRPRRRWMENIKMTF